MNELRREMFFEALGIPDDGRSTPTMTKEEFRAFDKPVVDYSYSKLIGKRNVEIFSKFEPYHDVSFIYCFDDDTVYENRFYIGE